MTEGAPPAPRRASNTKRSSSFELPPTIRAAAVAWKPLGAIVQRADLGAIRKFCATDGSRVATEAPAPATAAAAKALRLPVVAPPPDG
eukprot:SAG11_NODE_3949_length_2136_cov_13.619539_1_plen_88_part_00